MSDKQKPQLLLGVPCNKDQTPEVWGAMLGLRVPFKHVEWYKATGALTDAARNHIAKHLLTCGAEWLLFIDDDVEVQPDTLERLLSRGKEFCAGVYFRGKPPCDPLMYTRMDNGWYAAVTEWERGDLLQVDAVGLGAALIHRSVFEKIMATHFLAVRPSGALGLFPLQDVYQSHKIPRAGVRVHKDGKGAALIQKVIPIRPDMLRPDQQVPFFAFEYGRTEDLHFCELCKTAGVDIWVDTNVELWHWKYQRVGRPQFEQVKAWMKAQEAEAPALEEQDGDIQQDG